MEDWPKLIKEHFATVPFIRFMGVTIVDTVLGEAKLEMPMKTEYSNTYGITHGGIIAALVDMAAGVALRTLKLRIVTVETTANYFAPVSLDDVLTAEARLVQKGSNLLHADVSVTNSQNRLVGRGKAIYYVRGEDSIEFYQ